MGHPSKTNVVIREYKGTLDLGQMCSIWEAVTTYDHIVGPTKTFALR